MPKHTIMYLTDSNRRCLPGVEDMTEPEPSSVVLSQGETGSAWQRFQSDGLWYRAGGHRGVDWAWLMKNTSRLILVYDAPRREGSQ